MINDPRRDPELAALLREARKRTATSADTSRLTRRIRAAARSALLRRRYPAVTAIEYFASWSRRLLPLGVVCAFAGAIVLLARPAAIPATLSADEAVMGAATNRFSTRDLVELMLQSEDEPNARALHPLQSHE